MADLRNCAMCGRLYAYHGNDLCKKCMEKIEDDFTRVHRYVHSHPGAGIMEISEATGVDDGVVIRLIREGRLTAEGISQVLKCERCGTAITEGRYCSKCLYEINRDLQSILPSSPRPTSDPAASRTGDGMHIKKKGQKSRP